MKREYLVYAKRPMMYLLGLKDPLMEEWTSDKTKAYAFPTIKEAGQAITCLRGKSFCQKEGDCVIVPINVSEEGDNMSDFIATISHATNFWREEIVVAPDIISAWQNVFNLHMNHGRDVISVEVKKKAKKIRTPEQHDNIRCEKSL